MRVSALSATLRGFCRHQFSPQTLVETGFYRCERDGLPLEVDDQVSQRVSVGLRQVGEDLVHLSFAVVLIRNL